MDADIGDTHHVGSGAAVHAHSDNRHGGGGGRPGAVHVIHEAESTCQDGSLASLPPKTFMTTVQVQPGSWCCTGSEVVMNVSLSSLGT